MVTSLIAFIYTDNEGNVPLWETIMGRHESVTKLLIENGADISYTDTGQLACTAVEDNNLEWLKEIVQYGGDVTKPKRNGTTTALHLAVCEENEEIVKFLVERGAEIDKEDANGWTPRDFAEQQGHQGIKSIFQNMRVMNKKIVELVVDPIPNNDNVSCFGKFQSEPSTQAQQSILSQPPNQELTWLDSHRRRRANSFHNSIFGMISVANRGKYITCICHNLNPRMG